ncbi:MAG: DUF444 family protein [Planctomycetaceae bacterium]|nr:DUF444 family protein [Planctomycetaceae bacterium]
MRRLRHRRAQLRGLHLRPRRRAGPGRVGGALAREVPVARRIDQDVGRFRRIVRGQVRKNLRKYVTQGELLGRVGKGTVSIPLPEIRLPRFTFGDDRGSGVGMGEGGEGEPVPGQGGAGEAGEVLHELTHQRRDRQRARVVGQGRGAGLDEQQADAGVGRDAVAVLQVTRHPHRAVGRH